RALGPGRTGRAAGDRAADRLLHAVRWLPPPEPGAVRRARRGHARRYQPVYLRGLMVPGQDQAMTHILSRALVALPAFVLMACAEVTVDRPNSSGGSPCPAGAHRDDMGACEGAISDWVDTSSLVHWRWGHVTFTADTPKGAFLYVAAGFPNDDI